MSGHGHGRNDEEGGDAAKEISLSIEETNKLRASLGLPPLKDSSSNANAAKEEHKKRKRAEEDAANAVDLEEKVKTAKERRRQQDLLTKTKKLGEPEDDVDDVMAWVNKNRKITDQNKSKKSRPSSAGRKKSAAGAESDEEDEGAEHGAALAGMKVKFGADDLEAGEEMILTLEDRGILDEKGLFIDEEDVALENVLDRENKQRAKAFRDSQKKAKPLWEEDGQKRSLLDKYDEEEEETFLLDDAGAIEASKITRQDDIRAKLDAAKALANAPAIDGNGGGINGGGGPTSDYYTPEEMAAMRKPKKKKERKLKKKALTADELAALEEAAAADGGGGGDLGSRADRERRAKERTAAVAAADNERRSRFDAALSKANYASLALKSDGNDQSGSGENGQNQEEEEDEDLFRSLQKARELATKKTATSQASGGPEGIAAVLLKRREDAEASAQQLLAGAGAGAGASNILAGGLTFTDIGEFTRGITVKDDGGTHGGVPTGIGGKGDGENGVDVEMAQAPPSSGGELENLEDIVPIVTEEELHKAAAIAASTEKVNDGAWGSWAPVANAAEGEDAEENKPFRKSYRRRAAEEGGDGAGGGEPSTSKDIADASEGAVGGERNIGSGLAGALAFLKDRGELKQPMEWAGRMNDSRDPYFTRAMGGYKDVYTGGRSEDRLAQDVEVALTKKDKFGRILTPKEAFRVLCHDFHGIKPSKNTTEKRAKQVQRELSQRKAAAGVTSSTAAGLKAVQEAAAVPYMVLSGTVRPGQSRDALSGYATVDREGNGGRSVPKLGGGQTPLTGNAKVEAMLGMKPPPPRPPQKKK